MEHIEALPVLFIQKILYPYLGASHFGHPPVFRKQFAPEIVQKKSEKPQTSNLSNLKKNPYNLGNGNPKKASHILGNGVFQSTPRKYLILQEMETSPPQKKTYIFSQESISCISGTPKKVLYISFLYFKN